MRVIQGRKIDPFSNLPFFHGCEFANQGRRKLDSSPS